MNIYIFTDNKRTTYEFHIFQPYSTFIFIFRKIRKFTYSKFFASIRANKE
uniref:Ribosomal protein L23 n=1 Tax=Ascaris lumbricoides TaxID=6252 RepID=A0A0M3IFS3_ASCLU